MDHFIHVKYLKKSFLPLKATWSNHILQHLNIQYLTSYCFVINVIPWNVAFLVEYFCFATKVLLNLSTKHFSGVSGHNALGYREAFHHVWTSFSETNFPWGSVAPGGSRARYTGVTAPSSGDLEAFGPAMSVRTHPGQHAFSKIWGEFKLKNKYVTCWTLDTKH